MSTKRERLFNHPLRIKPVTLPTGDVVEARALGLVARSVLTKECTIDGAIDSVRLVRETVIASIYDPETNERLFTIGDREAIDAMGADLLDPMFNAAAALNGMETDAVEQAEKN